MSRSVECRKSLLGSFGSLLSLYVLGESYFLMFLFTKCILSNMLSGIAGHRFYDVENGKKSEGFNFGWGSDLIERERNES